MAFSPSSIAQGASVGGQATFTGPPTAQDGPELKEIQTSQIGFQSINGDARVKLLPSPWPMDALPPPSASLLSVASSRGIIAAAGPEGVALVKSESVRKALYAIPKAANPEDNVKPIEPDLAIPMPQPSHVLFSVDESVLVASPQEGGGIIAYRVDTLLKGETQPALQIATNNTGLRTLSANPSPDLAELFAAVTTNGELLMADLRSGGLRNGTDGVVLRTGVSCLSWSNKGKALAAGLANGSVVQITSEGTLMADIPKPPTLQENMHVSAMSWLENDTLFIIYTPTEPSSDGIPSPSDYYVVSRQPKARHFTFQKLPEVVPSFGVDRLPSFQFIVRLRNFKPHLQDLLLVASTTAGEVRAVTRADAPLSKDEPIINDFTLALADDDCRRALLPLSLTDGETWPIGLALDLSSKDTILKPIPGDDEITESSTPIPCLLVLNHEGVLSSWWIVYADSIREKTAYAGLVTSGDSSVIPQPQRQAAEPVTTQTTPPSHPTSQPSTGLGQPAFGKPALSIGPPPSTGFGQPSFGTPAFGSAAPFGKTAATPFGAPSSPSSFSSSTPAFGAPSNLGHAKPSWTSTGFDSAQPQAEGSGFGKPGFGTPTSIASTSAPVFGTSSGLGARVSPFGQPPASSTAANGTPAFGQPAGLGPRPGTPFGGASSKSPFASLTGNEGKPSGFAQFSGSRGFSDLKPDPSAGRSPFTKSTGDSSWSKASEPSTFGREPANGFGVDNAQSGVGGNSLGGGSTSFQLGSTFKADGTNKDDLPKPSDDGTFSFSGGLGDLLDESKKGLSQTHDREAEMDESDAPQDNDAGETPSQPGAVPLQDSQPPQSLVTPPTTIVQPKATPAPPLSSLFGTAAIPNTAQAPAQTQTDPPPAGNDVKTPPSATTLFGTATQPNTTPALVQNSKPGWGFGDLSSTTPKDSPVPKALPFDSNPPSSGETPEIKAEPPSDDETRDLSAIPEAPLPPDPTSKTSYTAGDTSVSSINSKTPSDDALPPAGFPSAKAPPDRDAEEAELPDDGELSSEYDGSAEDASEDVSPVEDPSENTEQIHTSPESSSGRGGDNTQELSPTGGLFTKITPLDSSPKVSRPLFGEIDGPVFLPPKPQESPRSPSPIRHLVSRDLLRPETSRSVSAPSRPSVIDTRRAQLSKSGLANQQVVMGNFRQKEDERLAAVAKARAKAEAEEALQLEDNEDERLRAELARPVSPSEELAPFLHHEQGKLDDGTKSGIPGQIERLYQDINAMVDTLGINARSLSAFMLYQQSQEPNKDWPGVLKSATPLDALNDHWVLGDIMRLQEGCDVLQTLLEAKEIADVGVKLQQCQELLGKDLFLLKSKLIAMRKVLHASSDSEAVFGAPLSAEQASLQHDFRKASTLVQTKLVEAEQNLTLLRAKLAEVAPPPSEPMNGASRGSRPRTSSQKKPTVEAVTNTIAKMTVMAEKKSADIDVLEAQLRKMGLDGGSVNASRQTSVEPHGTPQQPVKMDSSGLGRTPASTAGSVYHTPASKFGNSTRATPDTGRKSLRPSLAEMISSVSTDDKDRWMEKAHRRKEVERLLKEVLAEKRRKASGARLTS